MKLCIPSLVVMLRVENLIFSIVLIFSYFPRAFLPLHTSSLFAERIQFSANDNANGIIKLNKMHLVILFIFFSLI